MTACTRVHTEDSFKIRSYIGESPIIYAVHTLQEQSTFFILYKLQNPLLPAERFIRDLVLMEKICVVGRGIETTRVKKKIYIGKKRVKRFFIALFFFFCA